jgi:predicted lipoprotein with Yx(FWY)xxD motif
MSGSSPPTTGVVIGTAKGAEGAYLTGAEGQALYLWEGDGNGKSNCSGDCASQWPPLITKTMATPSRGVTAAGLGTIIRSDGRKQVTYMGHPLYYFSADMGTGAPLGEGVDSFGARWWLVAPSGAAITSAIPPPAGY